MNQELKTTRNHISFHIFQCFTFQQNILCQSSSKTKLRSRIIMESSNDKILFSGSVQDRILWIVHSADLTCEKYLRKNIEMEKLLYRFFCQNTTTLLTTVQQDKGLLTARSTLQQCVYLTSDLHVTPIELRYVICIKKSFCLQFRRSRKIKLQNIKETFQDTYL